MVQSYQETLNQISQNREKMYQALESLNGMWQGSAHDAFTAQYQSDNPGNAAADQRTGRQWLKIFQRHVQNTIRANRM